MKAAVIHGAGKITCDNVPDPNLVNDTDMILRVTATAISESDLYIRSVGKPLQKPMVIGHEFMGIVEETGPAVKKFKRGDRVIVPFPVACGTCFFCRQDLPGYCEMSHPASYWADSGAAYNDLYSEYDGGQAEYVRVPFADVGPRQVPEELGDEQVLFLTDIFPTGYSAIDWANVRGGETVVIYGAGPVGVMAAKSAWLRGAANVLMVDTLQYRLDKARETATCETVLWEGNGKNTVDRVRELTHGRGADLCVDAVGFEPARNLFARAKALIDSDKGSIKVLEACMSAVRLGGTVSVLGVFPAGYNKFPLGQFVDKGITLKAGHAPALKYIDTLLPLVSDGKVDLADIITHRLPLLQVADGYTMLRKKSDGCVKVVLNPAA